MKKNNFNISIILMTIFSIVRLYSFTDINYCALDDGEKVKLIRKSSNNNLIYIFTDINSCISCYESIKEIEKLSVKKDFNIYVIINGVNEEGASKIKNENGWKIDVISDDTGLLNSYYKIGLKPAIIGLSKDGIVIGSGNLNTTTLNKILLGFNNIENDKKKLNKSNNLIEVFRKQVIDNEKAVISNGLHIDVLYNHSKNEYYIKNLRSPSLLIANSEGKITKKLLEKQLNIDKSYYSNISLSWVIKDSVLCFINTVIGFKDIAIFYDVINDSIVSRIELNQEIKDNRVKCGYTIKFNKIINAFQSWAKIKNKNNIYIDSSYNTLLLFDKQGNYINSFNNADSIYKKFKLSTWFSELIDFNYESNNFITLQHFSNQIKIWDSKLNLTKVIEFEFDDTYRTIKADIPDLIGKEYYTQIIKNLTRTKSLLANNKNNSILICYYNEIYPENEKDIFSEDKIIDKKIIIVDDDGKWIKNSPYSVNGSFIPFQFENDFIYGTEINDNKQLEIVCYQIFPN